MFPSNSREQSALINAKLEKDVSRVVSVPRDSHGNVDYWNIYQNNLAKEIKAPETERKEEVDTKVMNQRYQGFLDALVSNCPKPNPEPSKKASEQSYVKRETNPSEIDYGAFRDLGALKPIGTDDRIEAELKFRNAFQTS